MAERPNKAKTDAAAWVGPVGDVWALEWRRTDRSFAGLSSHLNHAIAQAAPEGGARVADIGCGAGGTAIATASLGNHVEVTGFDLSESLIAIAGERAAAMPNCRFVAGPVERTIGAYAPFDLVVSRHGVMFFDDPVAGLAAIRAATRPGGHMVFSCFRAAALNGWASEIATAIIGEPSPAPAGYEPGPFAFADAAFTRSLLDQAGWIDAEETAVDFAYRAGEGDDAVADAVDYFGRIGPAARILKDSPAERRPAILHALRTICEAHRVDSAVDFPAAAWIWTARNPD
ncbi:SAM-dependent methyltransferase [Sphingobium fontiphilum]|uniref:SAM-dependent methyltransferase n=1 Tax=Sphingobium fontiphilum TaxID=944425 RepID=A0A7W6DHN1_9SPHN|nr:class I SAM-dependent methyltransferase [Sphingobium fontiphilum]MBB3980787.1 SAM-dependent methyltransferase [Sphingobium fontiphilum]